jgi:hypothetical protein
MALCDGAGNAQSVAKRALGLLETQMGEVSLGQLLRDETWFRWAKCWSPTGRGLPWDRPASSGPSARWPHGPLRTCLRQSWMPLLDEAGRTT